MLKVSREAFAAGEEQLISCAAERSKYYSICIDRAIFTFHCTDRAIFYFSRVGVVGSVFAAALT
jgi:hypothetical protein